MRYSLDIMMKSMCAAWTVVNHVTINESMIRYMGRAGSYIQYMPAKPIKHGIKVFCLCCAVSAALLSFEIYVGKENENRDNSALAVCDRLVSSAGLTANRGRVLYTDNYYTSVKLAKHMFLKYGWTIVGTIISTDKKSREDEDIPFLKLSNGARNGVKRGWYREAVLNQVGFSNGLSVKRHVKGKSTREVIEGPRAQRDYITFFNAVDRSDRDSADWSTSIRTNRYYIRILCWVLDLWCTHSLLWLCIASTAESESLAGKNISTNTLDARIFKLTWVLIC